MKKGDIIKGIYIIGVLDCIKEEEIKVRHVVHKYFKYFRPIGRILIENAKIPTRKEKEEYKKFLLKNGYSYYRGKVTKEL